MFYSYAFPAHLTSSNKQQKIFSSLAPINVNVKWVEYIITLIICRVDWFGGMFWIKVTIFLTCLTIACCDPSPLDYVNSEFVSIRCSSKSAKQDFRSVSDFRYCIIFYYFSQQLELYTVQIHICVINIPMYKCIYLLIIK